MRNIWLVIRREYLERVRSKAFLFSTALVPLFMLAVTLGPQKLATMKASGSRNIVVVTEDPQFGDTVRSQLKTASERTVRVSVDSNTTPAEHDALRAKVTSGEIDGFLWAPASDIAARKVVYTGREVGDIMEMAGLQKAVTFAAIQQRMVGRGIAGTDVDALLKLVTIDTVRLAGGKESKVSGLNAFFSAFTMVFALYMTLIIYGVAVLRSVLEEKATRIVEVLLSTISPLDLMIGKILGVGAVGLTQVLIWALGAFVFSSPALVAAKGMGIAIELPPLVLIMFPFYFLLGFLLYSASFAALGAAVNSEQEAQQFNIVVMSPMILSMVLMSFIIRQPNAPLSVVLSMFPFTAPILMFLRITVQQPPLWQIALSLVILAFSVFGMMWLCARIYRVGILMYGKRPTLPEIIRWLRYA